MAANSNRLGKVDFAQFLADRGCIEASQAEELRHKAEKGRVPIGQLFIRRGLCSVRQVMDLVARQAECPTVRFGELALRCKYVTTLQLEEVLSFQKHHRSHQIEVAQFERLMPKQELFDHVVSYVRFMELQSMEVDDEIERSFSQVG